MSASSTYSVFKFESVFHLFNSHLFKVGLGILFMILFCFIPYEFYKGFSKGALIAIAVVLVITLIIAPSIKGAGRWIDLGIYFAAAGRYCEARFNNSSCFFIGRQN